MARGPAPKPTALKIAADNPGKRPLPENEPKPEPGAGAPPAWLGADARKLWFGVAAPMVKCGLATSVDEHVLGRYCSLLALWIKALAAVEKAGANCYPVKNRHGKTVGHRELPQFSDLRRLGPQLTALEREFGMTPSARTRIRIQQEVGLDRDGDQAADVYFLAPPKTKRPGA